MDKICKSLVALIKKEKIVKIIPGALDSNETPWSKISRGQIVGYGTLWGYRYGAFSVNELINLFDQALSEQNGFSMPENPTTQPVSRMTPEMIESLDKYIFVNEYIRKDLRSSLRNEIAAIKSRIIDEK